MEKPVEYVIRNFQKGDEVVLARIFGECFGPVTPALIRKWHRRADVGAEDVFVGIVDGKLVSHVNTETKQLHHGEGFFIKTAGIAGVCTDSDFRKKGIVTRMLKLALSHAEDEGFSNASLYTDLDGPGHGIYQREGFVDILTFRTYTKYIDYPIVFGRWARFLNRLLKDDKLAARKLEGWEKSVVIHMKGVGILSFRFKGNRFQRLAKPPREPSIGFSTDLETYTKIMRGVLQWQEAVAKGKLIVERGESADIETLKRILNWRWHD